MSKWGSAYLRWRGVLPSPTLAGQITLQAHSTGGKRSLSPNRSVDLSCGRISTNSCQGPSCIQQLPRSTSGSRARIATELHNITTDSNASLLHQKYVSQEHYQDAACIHSPRPRSHAVLARADTVYVAPCLDNSTLADLLDGAHLCSSSPFTLLTILRNEGWVLAVSTITTRPRIFGVRRSSSKPATIQYLVL